MHRPFRSFGCARVLLSTTRPRSPISVSWSASSAVASIRMRYLCSSISVILFLDFILMARRFGGEVTDKCSRCGGALNPAYAVRLLLRDPSGTVPVVLSRQEAVCCVFVV